MILAFLIFRYYTPDTANINGGVYIVIRKLNNRNERSFPYERTRFFRKAIRIVNFD
jgi:hypothetical protein